LSFPPGNPQLSSSLWATHNLEGWSQHARRPVLADGQPDDTRCTGGKGEETTPQQTKRHIDERSNEQTRTNKQTNKHTYNQTTTR